MGDIAALLIVDVQVAFFDEDEPVYRGLDVLSRIKELIHRARVSEAPVIYVQHDGPNGDQLEPNTAGWAVHPEIAPAADDLVVNKRTPDSFLRTDLQRELAARGIGRLILMGFQSEYCIDTTCRKAWSLGYDVILVKDCHSTFDNPHLKAQQIVEHHSHTLGEFARVMNADEIELRPGHNRRNGSSSHD